MSPTGSLGGGTGGLQGAQEGGVEREFWMALFFLRLLGFFEVDEDGELILQNASGERDRKAARGRGLEVDWEISAQQRPPARVRLYTANRYRTFTPCQVQVPYCSYF